MSFVDFVKSRKSILSKLLQNKETEVHIVIGNESCDLDSAVSALCYAYLLKLTSPSVHGEYIPVLNIEDSDYTIRTELLFLLSKFGISQSDLIFMNDNHLEKVIQLENTSLHLVDHNVLTDNQRQWNNLSLLSVVDHHMKECPFYDPSKVYVRIETVGSCCSLVADLFYQRLGSVPDSTAAHLLRGTILCDSICLAEDRGKTFQLDKDMVFRLEEEHSIALTSRQSVFYEIFSAKEDVSGLSTEQLLRKDLKVVTVSGYTVLMSSIILHLHKLLERNDILSSIHQLLELKSAQIFIILSSGEINKSYEKHLILYSTDVKVKLMLTQKLDKDTSLELSPHVPYDLPRSLTVRKLSNTKISRKQVLPKIKEYLQVYTALDESCTRLRSDTADQLTFMLELSAPGTPSIIESPAPETESSSHDNSGYQTPIHPNAAGFEAPPNSYIENSLLTDPRLLPTFNNSDMITRIMIKKNKLDDEGLHIRPGQESESDQQVFPFTPVNSFVEHFSPKNIPNRSLPTLNNKEVVARIMQSGLRPMDGSPEMNSSVPFTPQNSVCDHHFIPPVILDESELEQKLNIYRDCYDDTQLH